MREEYYWDEIQGIGKLYIDIELVVGIEPVLFVCTVEDDNNSKYLVMTYDSCNGIYIITKINNKKLLDMLENRVTMEETFRNGSSILKTFIDTSDNMQFETFEASEFDEKLLPRKGEFFELRSRHILNYIERIKAKEKRKSYKLCGLQSMVMFYTSNKNYNMDDDFSKVIIIENSFKKRSQWELLDLGYSVNTYFLCNDKLEKTNLSDFCSENYNSNCIFLGRERIQQCVK